MPFGGLLTVTLIGAAAQAYGAHKASSAANKAAGQQVESADKGLALQKQIYEDQKAGMQPYAAFGRQGLDSLGALMGFPALPPQRPEGAAGSVAVPLDPNNPANWGTENAPMNMGDPRVQHLAKGGSLVDPEVSGQGTLGSMMSRSSYGGGSVGTAQPRRTIRFQAPNGDVRDVPEELASTVERAGARRVG